MVPVPDARLDKLAEIWQTNKKTPAIVEFVDIAGLVKGASKGEGLGNKFLGNIRECDALVHVVRCFDGTDIVHVEGSVDPVRDIETIDTELILSDLRWWKTALQKWKRPAKQAIKRPRPQPPGWLRLPIIWARAKNARTFAFDEEEDEQTAMVREMGLLTKKAHYLRRQHERGRPSGRHAGKPALPDGEKKTGRGRGRKVHSHLRQNRGGYRRLFPEEKKAFLAEMGIEATGLDNLIQASYSLLGLISFLTDGKKECRAWTIRAGTRAPQAAGKIHSDFERGFIRASVVAYDDFAACDFSMAAVKAKGLQRTEGKEYVVKDGDIIEFLFNV